MTYCLKAGRVDRKVHRLKLELHFMYYGIMLCHNLFLASVSYQDFFFLKSFLIMS